MDETKIAEFDGAALYKNSNGEMFTLHLESKGLSKRLLVFPGEAARLKEAMEKQNKSILKDSIYRIR